jgi:outer membrane receptor for monomeric catechols
VAGVRAGRPPQLLRLARTTSTTRSRHVHEPAIEHDFRADLGADEHAPHRPSRQNYVIGGWSARPRQLRLRPRLDQRLRPDPANWTVQRSRQISVRSNQILTNQTNLAAALTTGGSSTT